MPNHCENDLYIIGPWYGFEDADKAGVTWRAESETDEDEPRFSELKAKYHGSRGG